MATLVLLRLVMMLGFGVGANTARLLGLRGGVAAPRAAAPRAPMRCSFSASTAVVLADGTTKPIADVRVGDRVLATDPETGDRGVRSVTHVWKHEDVLVDLETSDGAVVSTTEDHPFWNATDRQWQPAVALDPGDRLLTATGTPLSVDGLDLTTADTGVAYNLTVADLHTYYVGIGEHIALVHNKCPRLRTQQTGDTRQLTAAQTRNLARYLGYRPTGVIMRKQRVFTNGENYIVQDVTSHSGGTWKTAESIKKLRSKKARTATTDALLNPIGQ